MSIFSDLGLEGVLQVAAGAAVGFAVGGPVGAVALGASTAAQVREQQRAEDEANRARNVQERVNALRRQVAIQEQVRVGQREIADALSAAASGNLVDTNSSILNQFNAESKRLTTTNTRSIRQGVELENQYNAAIRRGQAAAERGRVYGQLGSTVLNVYRINSLLSPTTSNYDGTPNFGTTTNEFDQYSYRGGIGF